MPGTPEIARRKIPSIAELPDVTVLPISLDIQREALRLCEGYGIVRQKYFHMQLVATMIYRGRFSLDNFYHPVVQCAYSLKIACN